MHGSDLARRRGRHVSRLSVRSSFADFGTHHNPCCRRPARHAARVVVIRAKREGGGIRARGPGRRGRRGEGLLFRVGGGGEREGPRGGGARDQAGRLPADRGGGRTKIFRGGPSEPPFTHPEESRGFRGPRWHGAVTARMSRPSVGVCTRSCAAQLPETLPAALPKALPIGKKSNKRSVPRGDTNASRFLRPSALRSPKDVRLDVATLHDRQDTSDATGRTRS